MHTGGAGPLAVAMVAGLAWSAIAGEGDAIVDWKSGRAAIASDAAATTRVLLRQGFSGDHVVVSLPDALTPAMRDELMRRGVRVLSPLATHAHFAALGANADAAGLVGAGLIRGASPVRPEWKTHPVLLAGQTPEWTVVEAGADPTVALYVTLFDDVPAQGAGPAIVAAHGGAVINALASVNAMVVHLPRSRVAALALDDAVQWIEPAGPALEAVNAQNRTLTGVNTVNAAPYNLNGAGVKVLVFDAGAVRTTHLDLQGRVAVIDGSFTSSHPTHVAGTIGGAGVSIAANRGMAPGVTFVSAEVSLALPGWLYNNPADIELDYAAAIDLGAHLANNSIGTNVGSNGFNCQWEGDYNTTDAVIDSIVRGSKVTNNAPFRVVWAAGNERSGGGGRCGSFYRTIGPPAGAKNHLSIGSVDADTDLTSAFSGWGPTDDGRMKPDFVAPGCQSGGDGGVTSCSGVSNTAYEVFCGTSMAAPTVSGIAALLVQDFRVQFPSAPDPRNSTLKVLFAQSAVDRGDPGPDYQYGYGSVRAPAAIDLMRTGRFTEGQVSQGADASFEIVVPAGAGELALTLAWDDPPATPNVVPTLVNDLDLEVFAPGGARAFPWTLDPNNPDAPAVRTARNTRDNLEQVRVPAPAAGTWLVRVKATAAPVGPQVYSLVSSHALDNGGAFPTLAFETFTPPAGIAPGVATPVSVVIRSENETLVPGSVKLLYRTGPGAYIEIPMAPEADQGWVGTIPALACGTTPEFYFSATGATTGVVTSGTAAAPYSAPVGAATVYFADAMDATGGWTAGTDTAFTGKWTRMDPQPTGAQPGDDTTPGDGGACWVTDGVAGNSMSTFDVDDGFTLLSSPTFDLSQAPANTTIAFMRWFETDSATAYADPWLVEISNNGGASWTTFESIPAGSPVQLGWRKVSRTLGSLGIAGTAQMKLRFRAEDAGAPGIVEAAIDDVLISSFACQGTGCYANCDGSTMQPILNVLDFNCFINGFNAGGSYANCDGSTAQPVLNILDFNCFLNRFTQGCAGD